MAICASDIKVILREVKLSQKPPELIRISTKSTVPVLLLQDGTVIDESRDIMLWALQHSDPHCWLDEALIQSTKVLIEENDGAFKTHLDHYKYYDRYPMLSQREYRREAEKFLQKLELLLQQNQFLLTDRSTLADVAILPFVRQFAAVEPEWFEQSPYVHLRKWLNAFIQSELFKIVMTKYSFWKDGESEVHFPR